MMVVVVAILVNVAIPHIFFCLEDMMTYTNNVQGKEKENIPKKTQERFPWHTDTVYCDPEFIINLCNLYNRD